MRSWLALYGFETRFVVDEKKKKKTEIGEYI